MAYGAVDRRVWNDERFRSWDRDTRDVWLYLLTCPHGNRLGCFVLPVLYAADDVQVAPKDVERAFRALEDDDRITWDPDLRMVTIHNHLHPDYNPLSNPNVVKAASGDLSELPDSRRCLRALEDAISRYGEPEGRDHYDTLLQEVRCRLEKIETKGYRKASRNGMPNQDPEPEQEQEQELHSPKSDEPLSDLWGIWIEELGGKPPHPRWTDKRRQKLRAFYREHLADEADPLEQFRRVLRTVQKSDHHMSTRSYQMPESLFRSEERRDRWMKMAMGNTGPNGTGWEDDL